MRSEEFSELTLNEEGLRRSADGRGSAILRVVSNNQAETRKLRT
jgi:hypothetical protein